MIRRRRYSCILEALGRKKSEGSIVENRHYFTDNKDLPSDRKEYSFFFEGRTYFFTTDEGVFSKSSLDYGSRVLLQALAREPISGKVLDMGCGYGAICVILGTYFPECEIDGADINSRAVELCRLNAEKNAVKVNAFVSDLYENTAEKYDVIATNPPIRAGKQVVFGDYEGAFRHLDKMGKLYVVIQKKQGAASSVKKLKELFGNCTVIARDRGYHVLKCIKMD